MAFYRKLVMTVHAFIRIGNHLLPSYGLMIAAGVITANIIGMLILRRNKLNVNDYIVLEGYAFLGGIVGAKGLYFLVSYKEIEWSRLFEWNYFNSLMQGGFVFYGGLVFGIMLPLMAGKLHGINAQVYIRKFIFLIPLIHAFGRIGCFLAGCCYGIRYHGLGAVTFPEQSFAPGGISLFPVQLVEAVLLFLIAVTIFALQEMWYFQSTIEMYLLLYSIVRFALEFLRGDIARGKMGLLFTSQWISILFIVLMICYFLYANRCRRSNVLRN